MAIPDLPMEPEPPVKELARRVLGMLAAAMVGALVGLMAMAFFGIFTMLSMPSQPTLTDSLAAISWHYEPTIAIALGSAALLAGQLLRWLPEGRTPSRPG